VAFCTTKPYVVRPGRPRRVGTGGITSSFQCANALPEIQSIGFLGVADRETTI
jgi:hypothetical protein